MGPASRTSHVSPSGEGLSFHNVIMNVLVESYVEHVNGLYDGSCDLLMIETIFGTRKSKAVNTYCSIPSVIGISVYLGVWVLRICVCLAPRLLVMIWVWTTK